LNKEVIGAGGRNPKMYISDKRLQAEMGDKLATGPNTLVLNNPYS